MLKQKILLILISALLCSGKAFSLTKLDFVNSWPPIEEAKLSKLISERRKEILIKKEHWKEKLGKWAYPSLLEEGQIFPVEEGNGGTYILYDKNNTAQFIIKPNDEDIFCLNNRKSFASPFFNTSVRVKNYVPTYRSAQTEALASAFATILKLDALIPKTELAVLASDQFFDIEEKPGVDKEKLSSIQKYVPLQENLYQLASTWLTENVSEDEILQLIHEEDFENLTLLIWLLYDTDAHAKNIYATQDASGIYRLIKIDNGLCFPTKNSQLFNALYFLPQSKNIPSKRLHSIIENLPIEELKSKMYFYEMAEAVEALEQRIELLKKLIKENLNFREIDTHLRIDFCE